MRFAATSNGSSIDARDLERLPAAERESFRGLLSCPECDATASFRRRSVDGKAACFHAKHNSSCSQARKVTTEPASTEAVSPRRNNSGTVTEIVLSASAQTEHRRAILEAVQGSGTSRHHNGSDVIPTSISTLSLAGLLHHLVRAPEHYSLNDIPLVVPERGSISSKDGIRLMKDISRADVDNVLLVWGPVETIRTWGEYCYVNQGNAGVNNFALRIPANLAALLATKEEWQIATTKAQFDEAPVYVLALGRVRHANGATFGMDVVDLRHMVYFVGPDGVPAVGR